MQKVNLDFVIAQARDDRQKAPLAKAVGKSVEVGVVVPSILRSNLAAAGFKVAADQTTAKEYGFGGTNVLKRVLVLDKKGVIVAMGASSDVDDALLHAMLGWFRENPLEGADVPEGIASKTVAAG